MLALSPAPIPATGGGALRTPETDPPPETPTSPEAAIAAFGRDLTGIAYLVLQHGADADATVAGAIAAAWRPSSAAGGLDHDALRRWLARETARHALDLVRRTRTVDAVMPTIGGHGSAGESAAGESAAGGPAFPRQPSTTFRAIAELPPRTRAAVALRFVAGWSVEETAAELRLSVAALRDALRPVYRRLGSAAPQPPAGPRGAAGEAPMEPTPELVWRGSVVAAEERMADPAVAAAIRAEVATLPVRVTGDAVRAALAARPRRRLPPWWPLGALGGALVLAVVGLGALGRSPGVPPSVPTAPSATPFVSSGPAARGVGQAPVSLADCRIEPKSAALAFSGWVTLEALQATGAAAAPSEPVYAVVTRGLAEWSGGGTSPSAGPSVPGLVGRMGCVFDPTTGQASRVEVPLDWTPPAIADGCPAAGTDTYAGEQELGGPRAFIVTFPALAWTAAEQGTQALLVRLDPVPPADAGVGAWLRPLGPGERRPGVVTPGGAARTAPTTGTGLRYYRAVLPAFDAPGCWVIGFTVDGRDAGSVIVPVLPAR